MLGLFSKLGTTITSAVETTQYQDLSVIKTTRYPDPNNQHPFNWVSL